MSRRAVVLLAVFGLSVLALAAPAEGGKYALIVGVTEYDSAKFPNLTYTENDAEELAKLLKGQGFTVTLMTNKQGDKPTAANIRKALSTITQGKKRKDLVLLAFSGHGIQLEVSDPDEKKKARSYGYFCPMDASLAAPVSFSTGRCARLVSLDATMEAMGKCDAGSKFVLLDACRNEMKASASTRSADPAGLKVPAGVGVLFSCKSGEKSFEVESLKHGLFFYHVLQGLRGEARNKRGEITWNRLVAHVAGEVKASAGEVVGGGAVQIPFSSGLEVADAVLLRADAVSETPKAAKQPEAKRPIKGIKPVEKSNALKMKFMLLPSGEYERGSAGGDGQADDNEKPRHKVRLTHAFWLGTCEVTQQEYREVMGENSSAVAQAKGPVTNVTWLDAIEFCNRLSKKLGHKPYYDCDGDKVTILKGDGYRLPTEAEWEWACRAGTAGKWSFGNDVSNAPAHGRFLGKKESPALVGTYKPNAWGLFDMHGNVREWCWDYYEAYPKARGVLTDPHGGSEGNRVARGGSFKEAVREARSAARYHASPKKAADDIGFRVARTPGE